MMEICSNTKQGIYTIESRFFDFELKKIIVFDVFGNQLQIIENPDKKQEIDLRNFASGMYHISAVYDQEHPPVRIKIFKK